MKKEILLKVDDNIFGLKALGICLCNNRILLKKGKNNTYSFPGGNISFNENSKDALVRKFTDEIGGVVLVSQLNFVFENFTLVKNTPCHEICFYYKVTILDKKLLMCDSFNSLKNGDDVFEWVPLDKIASLNVKPLNIAEVIENIGNKNIKHIF